MRLVTFQSKEITEGLLKHGIVQTLRDFKGTQFLPDRFSRTRLDRNYLLVDGKYIKYSK
jgi:hypothetical protein